MAEKKGMFSRFFSKKKDQAKEAETLDAEDVEAQVSEDARDLPPAEVPLAEEAAPVSPHDLEEAETDQAERTIAPGEEPPVFLERGADTDEDAGPPPPLDEPLPEEAAAPEEPVSEAAVEAPAPTPADAPEPTPEKKRGLFSRLTSGLAKTSQKFATGVSAIFTKRKLDDDTLEELEDLLITADLGVPAATRIITTLAKSKYDQEVTDEEVRTIVAEEIAQTLSPLQQPLTIDVTKKPHVILVIGVNGAGKTTTIGKLAKKFSDDGQSVLLAAGDTFRAAAIEQLKVWGERTGAPVVSRPHGADAAGLAFDAIKEAQEKSIDIVMIDTAGRLQNRRELMDELAKIVRVIKKLDADAPHSTLLVLDATVGQNALSQAQTFTEIAGVSGLVMTKLDGTARGGVLVAVGDKFALPIHYIGVGESVEDLQPFNAQDFAKALTAKETETV